MSISPMRPLRSTQVESLLIFSRLCLSQCGLGRSSLEKNNLVSVRYMNGHLMHTYTQKFVAGKLLREEDYQLVADEVRSVTQILLFQSSFVQTHFCNQKLKAVSRLLKWYRDSFC